MLVGPNRKLIVQEVACPLSFFYQAGSSAANAEAIPFEKDAVNNLVVTITTLTVSNYTNYFSLLLMISTGDNLNPLHLFPDQNCLLKAVIVLITNILSICNFVVVF